VLDAIPLDSNGKIDRWSLPAPANIRPVLDTPYVAARNETEQQIACIWSQVLEVLEVGVHDNFLELGGNSVQAMMITNRLSDIFEIHLSPVIVFQALTVAKMARVIQDRQTSQESSR